MTTSVIFSPIYYQHNPGRRHPESAERLRAIVRDLKGFRSAHPEKVQFTEPAKAQHVDVQLVHSASYIRTVEDACRSGGSILDAEGDTVVTYASCEVALHAVGGTLKAVDLVMEGTCRNSFALVRPPGHHAGRDYARGFCIFNNVALAAEYLLRKFGLKRVLILDIDAHHGNGTQEIFYATDRVLYLSLHEDPRVFPGTGFVEEIGEGEGLGHNVNVPLPFGSGDQIYLRAFKEIAQPIVRLYKPEFTLVSTGLDCHYTDPVGSLSLSIAGYREIIRTIVRMASSLSCGRLLCVLEGGYSLSFLGRIATTVVAEMSSTSCEIVDDSPRISESVGKKSEQVLREVKRTLSRFWDL